MKSGTLLLAVLSVFAGCSGPTQTAGGTSDTGNPKIVARIIYADSTPAVGAIVRLRRSDYLPGRTASKLGPGIDSATLTTDSSGRLAIASIRLGDYLLEVNDQNSSAVAVRISLDDTGAFDLGTRILAPFAAVQGRVLAPDESLSVFISGMERIAKTDSLGAFSFANLPAGTFSIRVLAATLPAFSPGLDSIRVYAGETRDVAVLPGWKYARSLLLNTTDSGVRSGGVLVNFPVLVRLSKGIFDFSKAQPGGKDLRFTDRHGNFLPFQVDYWDATGERAGVWIRVDTLADGVRAPLFMHWGNPGVSGDATGPAFDTADGFAGVWHLEEDAPDMRTPDVYKDALVSGNHGNDMIPAGSVACLIGSCPVFDSFGYVDVEDAGPGLRPSQAITVSAWIRNEAIDTNGAVIVGMGDNWAFMLEGPGRPAFSFRPPVGPQVWCRDSTAKLKDSLWHHVAATFDGDTVRLYVDGASVASLDFQGVIGYTLGNALVIGKHGKGMAEQNYDFGGNIDEVQVSRSARPPGWMHMSYENQRENQVLVEFK